MDNFLCKFSILIVEQIFFIGNIQSKKFLTGCFDFFFLFSSAILLSKMKSLFLNLCTSFLWVKLLLQVPITTGSVYQASFQKRSVSTYLTWYQGRNWLASMIKFTLIFNPSYVYHPTIWTFSGQHLFQNFLGILNKIQSILE